jgi:peptidoglycan/LPS O-acetylase OafA/YrhL
MKRWFTHWGLTLAEHERAEENNYQFLRFMAALAVVYGHSYGLTLVPHPGHDLIARILKIGYAGDQAVNMFFVISGFLVAASYVHRHDLLVFAKARALRIFPGLLVCLVLTTFVLGPIVSSLPLGDYLTDASVWRYFFDNATLTQAQFFLPGIFTGGKYNSMNGPLWTLPIEMRMYIAVALFGFAGVLRKRWLANLALATFALCLFARPEWVPALTRNPRFPPLAYFFIAGMAAYMNRDWLRLDWKILALLFGFVLAMIRLHHFLLGWDIFLAYATFYLAYVPNFRWYNRVGDYSYGVYIYGWPVQQVLANAFPSLGPLGLFACAGTVTVGIAAMSWHFIEAPALRLKSVSIADRMGWRAWLKLDGRFGGGNSGSGEA